MPPIICGLDRIFPPALLLPAFLFFFHHHIKSTGGIKAKKFNMALSLSGEIE